MTPRVKQIRRRTKFCLDEKGHWQIDRINPPPNIVRCKGIRRKDGPHRKEGCFYHEFQK